MIRKSSTFLFAFLFLFTAALAFAADGPEKAEKLFKQRENSALYQDAMLAYEQYFQKNKPETADKLFLARAYYYLGDRYAANKKQAQAAYRLAVKWANDVLEADPKNVDARFLKAVSIYRYKQYNDKFTAVDAMKKAREELAALQLEAPKNPEPLYMLGRLHRISVDAPMGFKDIAKSRELLDLANKIDPKNPFIMLDLARTMAEQGQVQDARHLLMQPMMDTDTQWDVEYKLESEAAKDFLKSLRSK